MKLIFLGAPGAGKGTHANAVSEKLGIPTISTGNMIREAMKVGTKAGLEAKSYVEAGQLVPDGSVIEMLSERIAREDCKNGYILDGYPRTVAQAKALDDLGIIIDKVIDLEVPDQMIEDRITGRRICEACGSIYHVVYNPSAKGDLCASCGEPLVIRKDDSPEIVRDRLKVYHEQTDPLKDYYSVDQKLVVVTGAEEVAETTRRVLAALEA